MMARKFGRIVNITSSAVKALNEIRNLSNGARAGSTGFIANNVTITGGHLIWIRLRGLDAVAEAARRGVSVEILLAEHGNCNPAGRIGGPEEFGQFCAFSCGTKARLHRCSSSRRLNRQLSLGARRCRNDGADERAVS